MKTMIADFFKQKTALHGMLACGLIAGMLLPACGNKEQKTTETTTRIETPETHAWNLNVPAQNDFTMKDVELFAKPVYDSAGNEPQFESPEDTVSRSFEKLVFFDDGKKLYAAAVCENAGPMYGAATGWCDVFVFAKENGQWKMTDYALNAGGGGMYGNSGQMDTIVRVGRQAAGIVLGGGQTHMGALFHDDVVMISKGRIQHTVHVYTHHDYGVDPNDEEKFQICEDNKYEFLDGGGELFDLKIIKSDCVNDPLVKDSITIPYKNGYQVPERFQFDS